MRAHPEGVGTHNAHERGTAARRLAIMQLNELLAIVLFQPVYQLKHVLLCFSPRLSTILGGRVFRHNNDRSFANNYLALLNLPCRKHPSPFAFDRNYFKRMWERRSGWFPAFSRKGVTHVLVESPCRYNTPFVWRSACAQTNVPPLKLVVDDQNIVDSGQWHLPDLDKGYELRLGAVLEMNARLT